MVPSRRGLRSRLTPVREILRRLDEVPVLEVVPEGDPRATVLVYHGLTACKETQRKELHDLAFAGYRAVGVDAVGHGERRRPGPGTHREVIEIVDATAAEVPRLLDRLGEGPFAIAGISMGGYVTFAAASREPRLRTAVSILGCPDWTVRGALPPDLASRSPHLRPEGFAHCRVFAWNAGRDVHVPPGPAREFLARLPGRHLYLEYPESEHFMREADWEDGWARTLSWLGEP